MPHLSSVLSKEIYKLSSQWVTEDLINEYKQDQSRFKVAEEALKQRAIDESGFKVGDIIKLVPGGSSAQNSYHRFDDSEHVIAKLSGELEFWTGTTVLSVRAWTRKRTKSGAWHGTRNERYRIAGISINGAPFWEVIGHEYIKEQL